MPEDRIEVWPVMGRLAIALRETLIFRFWCILLHLARKQAKGRRINNVIIHVDDLSICSLKLVKSSRTMRRYLVKAKELGYVRDFVALGNDRYRVYFAGQKRTAAALQERAESEKIMNAEEWDRRKLFITFSDFAQITKFSGAIFASWIAVAVDHERRVTWEYLSKMWTVSRQAMEVWIATQPEILKMKNDAVTRSPYHVKEKQWNGFQVAPGLWLFQRGNTFYISKKNASQRFAAQGQIWSINGLAGQSTLSTAQGISTDVSPLSSRHNRHSVRPVRRDPNNPYDDNRDERRTNYSKPRAFAKWRSRHADKGMYLLLKEEVGLRRFRKARRVWHYSAPLIAA